MNKRIREATRYLGYGKHVVDDHTLSFIQESFHVLDSVAAKKMVYRIFPIDYEEDCFSLGKVHIYSKNLGKNLKGCDQIILFGATLGNEVDVLMNRYAVTDMSQALILQSCAATLLEEYCDECVQTIARQLERDHLYLRPRFSPGYGDFDISYQKNLIQILDTAKTIGLTITDSYMMSPTKSVTAVIGISHSKEQCKIGGCEECSKLDCEYRRDRL